MAAVAVKYPAFKDLGAEILAVSVDPVATHRAWHQRELSHMVPGGVLFPMLHDLDGTIGRLYNVYDEANGMHLRGHFVIDPDGIIQAMEVLAAPIGRDVSEILRQLRALQHHRATGDVMPCGWEPGKPSLPMGEGARPAPGEVWKGWKPRNAF
jgi:peroxiredoxin (alkyl hydroperoxide reductase subunit C)